MRQVNDSVWWRALTCSESKPAAFLPAHLYQQNKQPNHVFYSAKDRTHSAISTTGTTTLIGSRGIPLQWAVFTLAYIHGGICPDDVWRTGVTRIWTSPTRRAIKKMQLMFLLKPSGVNPSWTKDVGLRKSMTYKKVYLPHHVSFTICQV